MLSSDNKKPYPRCSVAVFSALALLVAKPCGSLAQDATTPESETSQDLAPQSAEEVTTAPPAPVQDTDMEDGKKLPVVIVLMLGTDQVSRRINESFVTELKLALDGFAIKQIETGVDDFDSLLLPERLERIRPFVDEFDAVATTWIEKTDTDATLLNLVALSTGRALVRIVEARTGPKAERELALAAQELLGEAYLFKPEQEHEAVEKVVTKVKQNVIAGTPQQKSGVSYGLLPLFEVGGGLYGHKGPALNFGGGLAIEVRPFDELFFRIGAAFIGFPRQRPEDGVISGWRMDPNLTVGYDWRLGRFMVGPMINLAATYYSFDMYLGYIYNQKFTWWNFRGALGLDLRVEAIKNIYLTVNPSVGAYPYRKSFARLSNGDEFLVTPYLDWNLMVGIAFFR